jgi:predicted DNA-binding protein (MmcQ/YjbR family)
MIELEDVREYCLLLPEVTEGYPFGEDHLVFKVKDKMFCLMSLEAFPSTMNLKCEPDRAIELREQYDGIAPGYHMNKKHWNTLTLDGSIPDDVVLELVRHSFDRVVKGLKKSERDEINEALRIQDEAVA